LSVLFKDRLDAGRKLAEALFREDLTDPVILAIPRGGIPVAHEIASALSAPLSVVVARKLGAPCQPEFGIGAIAEGDGHVLDQTSIGYLGITRAQIDELLESERRRLEDYVSYYRQGRPLPDIRGRCAVLVDDGLATGVTVQAAAIAVARLGPALTVVAAPVGSAQAVEVLRSVAGRVVTVSIPSDFRAVGQFYRDFDQLPDETLLGMLS
jgi:putative phosphoribosyl transferase